MSKTIDLIKLNSDVDEDGNYIDKNYELAYMSYKDIYNSIMVRGKGNLDARSLEGKPVNLTLEDVSSMVNNEYYVSTKADGYRFFMLFSKNQYEMTQIKSDIYEEDKLRNVYFINTSDGELNFWQIETSALDCDRKLPKVGSIDKCLFDGEILMWGKLEKYLKYNIKTDKHEIIKYSLTYDKNNNVEPLIAFLAFDVLFGSIGPVVNIEDPKNKKLDKLKKGIELDFKNSIPMLEFKGGETWPTCDRRYILETLFQNKLSKNMIEYVKDIKADSNINFSILVSPFIEFSKLLEYENIYDKMISVFTEDLIKQLRFYLIDDVDPKNAYKNSFYFNTNEYEHKEIVEEKQNGDKLIYSNVFGLGTDGMILTPKYYDYLVGNWSFSENKQFKWKPDNMLTIDFEVGQIYNDINKDIIIKGKYYYKLKTRSQDKLYLNKIPILESDIKLNQKIIVETNIINKMELNESNMYPYILFTLKKIRPEKNKSNAEETIKSILDIIKIGSQNILDFVVKISKLKNIKKLNNINHDDIPFFTNNINKNYLLKKVYFTNPLSLLSDDVHHNLLESLNKAMLNENFEFENRLMFNINKYKNNIDTRPYLKYFIKNYISRKYKIEPIIRTFNNNSNYRSTWSCINNNKFDVDLFRIDSIKSFFPNFMLESIVIKEQIDSNININVNDIYPQVIRNFTSLSKETTVNINDLSKEELLNVILNLFNPTQKLEEEIIKKLDSNKIYNNKQFIEFIFNSYFNSENKFFRFFIKYTTQIRYIINSPSLFWRIDLFEYGEDTNLITSMKKCVSGPSRTNNPKDGSQFRIELEYKPGDLFKELLTFYNFNKESILEHIKTINHKNNNNTNIITNMIKQETPIEFINHILNTFYNNEYENPIDHIDEIINNILNTIQSGDPNFILNDLLKLQLNIFFFFFN